MSAYGIFVAEDDEEAFAAVYRAHSQKLLRYCQYRLRDRHEAEDVVQEAFARAWRTLPPAATAGNFYPWLRVVAANLCTDVLRKRSRSEPVAVIELGAVDGEMDRLTDDSDRVLVRQALGRLNDRHRSALIMRESEGLTYDQIAQRTGATAGTVESLLWRARQALRREFTVLAGREGSLAVVPLVILLAGRTRSAGRRAWIRLIRRFPAFDPSSDTPFAHVALAAVAALTVATGVAATVAMGANRAAHPSVVLQDHTLPLPPAAGPAPPGATAPPAPLSPATSTAGTGPSAGVAAAAPVATVPVTAPALGGAAPLRVVSPVVTGHAAAAYAAQEPVSVDAGGIVVGASPPAAATYLGHVTQRVSPPLASVVTIVLQENKP